MNNIENIIIELFKKNLITAEDFVNFYKELAVLKEKNLVMNYDGKSGTVVKVSIPNEIIKGIFQKLFDKIVNIDINGKEENAKDEIMKNILKLVK